MVFNTLWLQGDEQRRRSTPCQTYVVTAFRLPSFPKPRLPSASDEGMKVWRGEGGHLRGGSAGPGGERPPAAARGNSGSADGANKRRRQPRAPRSPTRGRGVGAPGAGSGPRAPAPNTELVGEGGKEAKGWGSPTRRWDPPAPAQPRTPPSLLSETSAAA